MNRGYFGGDDSKPTLGANRDIPEWCRSTHLWRDAPAFSVHPLEKKKKRGTLNSRLGSLPDSSQSPEFLAGLAIWHFSADAGCTFGERR